MQKLQAQIEINKPIEDVFSYISNLKNLPFWGEVDGVEVEWEGESTRYTAFNKNLLSVTRFPLEITKIERPFLFAFKNSSKAGGEFCYSLESLDGGGVLVKVDYELAVGVTFSVLNFGGTMQVRLERLLKNLKKRVEALADVEFVDESVGAE